MMKLPLNDCKVTLPYGVERNGKIHTGIDLVSTSGDREIKAIANGVVRIVAFDKNGYGNYISVEQDDGYRALYCHLESVKVVQGKRVVAGEVLGIEGTTGNSTGIHLHLEIRQAPFAKTNHIDVASYLGIENLYGDVREIQDKFTDEKEALAFLIQRGIINDGAFWFKALDVVQNQKYMIIKFANYVYTHP